jgi:hypothetical protein
MKNLEPTTLILLWKTTTPASPDIQNIQIRRTSIIRSVWLLWGCEPFVSCFAERGPYYKTLAGRSFDVLADTLEIISFFRLSISVFLISRRYTVLNRAFAKAKLGCASKQLEELYYGNESEFEAWDPPMLCPII